MNHSHDNLNAPAITLAHGEGGRLTRRLIEENVTAVFDNPFLSSFDDAARLPQPDGPIAVTTDSFVVSPLFFPGGDIGKLAVYGTVNDLAVTGAKPLYITLAMIIEESLPIATLERVLGSVAEAAANLHMPVVAGDTKVVPKGAADKLFLNTTGVGTLLYGAPKGPSSLEVGDQLIVSGPIGRHGIAVMSAREGLGLDPPPHSDCAPLSSQVRALVDAGIPIRAMRDATRGGLAAVLHEWASCCDLTLRVEEQCIPVAPDVRGACELLGLDPIYVANEGTMLIAVPDEFSNPVLETLHNEGASGAELIGSVVEQTMAPVVIRRGLGRMYPLDEPTGAMLPRIC